MGRPRLSDSSFGLGLQTEGDELPHSAPLRLRAAGFVWADDLVSRPMGSERRGTSNCQHKTPSFLPPSLFQEEPSLETVVWLFARPHLFGKTPPLHYRPEPPSTRPLVLSRFLLFHCSVDLQKDKAGGVGGPGNTSQSSQIQIWCNKRQIAVAGRGRPPATFISPSEPANHEFGSGGPTPICCLVARTIANAAAEAARDKEQCINSPQQLRPLVARHHCWASR